MGILVDETTRVVVQGITGREGSFHAKGCKEYGTQVVAGVTPGKGGQEHEGVPVFDSVAQAVDREGANTSLIFVPPPFAADAILEAADAGIRLIVCITEGIPVRDMIPVYHALQRKSVKLIGPNCPGVITPGKAKVGIMPGFIHLPGCVGVVSRSGTLTYEAVKQLTDLGLGQSTCIGIGGDPIIGLRFVDLLKLFAEDVQTEAVLLIGEIGGTAEDEAARYVMESRYPKPVIGFVAGKTAPPGRRMGHAGAIVSGGRGTAAEKQKVMEQAGLAVCPSPDAIGTTVQKALASAA
jgi:succinyl-CoA synthetase alpha subunit